MPETTAKTTVSRTKPVLEYLRAGAVVPVSSQEFMSFWTSCSEEEKQRFYEEAVALTPAV